MNRARPPFGFDKLLSSGVARGIGLSPAVARMFTARGNEAKKRRDWAAAATLYAESLSIHERNAHVHIQYANALRETGRLEEAVASYRRATVLNPRKADAWAQLGHVLKRMGDGRGATQAFRQVLLLNPGSAAARDQLIAAGGRGEVPATLIGQAAAAVESARLTQLFSTGAHGLANLTTVTSFPQGDHYAFRTQYPIQSPPGAPSGPVRVRVSCRGVTTPALLRATLLSLVDQRHQDWTAHVTSAGDLADHSVASYAHMDPRIRFTPLTPGDATPVVLISAGDVLDREALGWLGYALARTAAAAVYSDHDHYSPDWRAGPVQHSPQLQPMFDVEAMKASSSPPSIAILADAGSVDDDTTVLTALTAAATSGPVAHLPRLLVSRPVETATDGSGPADVEGPRPDSRSILVVIPTRDEAEMLERCVRSLIAHASRPERVRIVIVDNRSQQPETAKALARLIATAGVETLVLDEPFNWPRCNNGAVQGRDGDILVFANNDMEMLSKGWDDELRLCLASPEVGVVGARLLYPDGGVQHAGILMGTWDGRPSHDGLWVGGQEQGPLRRWTTTHYAAAVTGAFIACRRDTFDRIGGFDERLSIAYNDIDFCLKARELGLKVVYCPKIELTHYESRTRGHNDSPEKVAWDDAELSDMHQRWGPWLFHDPSYNPQWAMAVNRPYDGIRDLALSRVLGHLDASASADPWAIVRERKPEVSAGGRVVI